MKEDLLKRITLTGYNVSYGANLNFATYEIVKKYPGIIAFLSIVFGILGLKVQMFANECVSIILLILGVASVYIEHFTENVESYSELGMANTNLLNRLKELYYEAKSMDDDADFSGIKISYREIEKEFNSSSQPNQILFSNWFAHYKLFWEKDVSWMDEQLHFKFWKDKIPQSMKAFILAFAIVIIAYYCYKVPIINEFFCTILYID